MRLGIITLLLALLLAAPIACASDAIDLNPAPTPEAELPAQLPPLSPSALEEALPFNANCGALLLAEQQSGQIIFAMNPDSPRPVASVTKVMTILLALEMLDAGRLRLEDPVSVSKTAAGMGGSQVLLDVGERQTAATLLKSMIVGSANDAAVALAEAMYGSEAACVEAMNARAAELGMEGTHFVNCTGLPAEGQHTTARDVAVMARQMFSHDLYYEYSKIWMEDIDHGDGRATQLVNTNKLLRLYDGCDGGKTGSTQEAGYCVAATATRGGMRLVAVVLGAPSGAERFDLAARMLDHGFANYRLYPVARAGTRVRGELPVTGGAKSGVGLALLSDLTLLVRKGEEQDIRLVPDLPESVPAPVAAGDRVGTVAVVRDERTLAEIPVAACESVEARGIGRGIEAFWRLWTLLGEGAA